MTLVVCWGNEEGLTCAADSRLSNPSPTGSTPITDTGAKLFMIPVNTYCMEEKKPEKKHSYTLGFAFCGSALLAINTHAIASNCTQLILNTKDDQPASMDYVSDIYLSAAKYVVTDMNKNFDKQRWQFFDCIIFGFCTISKTYRTFHLTSKIENNQFSCLKTEIDLGINKVLAMGSGSEEFMKQLDIKNSAGQNRAIWDIVQEIIYEGNIDGVGGHMQVMGATEDGAYYYPLLTQDPENLDQALVLVNGFNTSSIEGNEGFSIGTVVRDLNVNKIAARHALREFGINPDNQVVDRFTQNIASITLTFKCAFLDKKKVSLSDNFSIGKLSPENDLWYFYKKCRKCRRNTPLFQDYSKGKYFYQVEGNGSIIGNCLFCSATIKLYANIFKSAKWNGKSISKQ